MDEKEQWEKEKNGDSKKFLLSKKDADEKIYPTSEDMKNVLAKYQYSFGESIIRSKSLSAKNIQKWRDAAAEAIINQ